jgi:murein DD-endopeptidase MepM/ murein hydrolase activator NlpD
MTSAIASPLEMGRALTTAFYTGELDSIWSAMSARVQQGLGGFDGLVSLRAQVLDGLGAETVVIEDSAKADAGTLIYRRIAQFAKVDQQIEVLWVFDGTGLIAGFFIRPIPREAASDRLDYCPHVRLRLPVVGAWTVFWGGRSIEQNYHASTVDQRFAYDLLIVRDGSTHSGQGEHNAEYFCFGLPIVAPAAGRVVTAQDGVVDNAPGKLNPEKPLGNHVILDHGDSEFSILCHLRQGSVRVRPDEIVEDGDRLGDCGNSGNSTEPHLHFHLQDTTIPFKGRGLPAPFSDYLADGQRVALGEPVRGQVVERQR